MPNSQTNPAKNNIWKIPLVLPATVIIVKKNRTTTLLSDKKSSFLGQTRADEPEPKSLLRVKRHGGWGGGWYGGWDEPWMVDRAYNRHSEQWCRLFNIVASERQAIQRLHPIHPLVNLPDTNSMRDSHISSPRTEAFKQSYISILDKYDCRHVPFFEPCKERNGGTFYGYDVSIRQLGWAWGFQFRLSPDHIVDYELYCESLDEEIFTNFEILFTVLQASRRECQGSTPRRWLAQETHLQSDIIRWLRRSLGYI